MYTAKDAVMEELEQRRAVYRLSKHRVHFRYGESLSLQDLALLTRNSHRTIQRAVAALLKAGRVSVSRSDSRLKLVSLASQSASLVTGRARSRPNSSSGKG